MKSNKALHGKAARRARLARLARTKKIMDDGYAGERAAHEARLRERAARIAATGKGIRGPQADAAGPGLEEEN